MAEPLTDEDLIELLRKEEASSRSYQDGTLAPIREESNNYYDRMPYGDEQEGSSSVVTSEFADSVESMMPGIMEVFTGGDQVVQFAPTAPGQEDTAKEATDYVAHCVMQRNGGFLMLHASIKDALMHRLGGVTVDLEDYEDKKTEQAQGIGPDAVDILKAQAKEQGAEIVLELTPDAQVATDIDPVTGEALPVVPTLSGTVSIIRKLKRAVCEAIAPEDIIATWTARDQDKASLLGFCKKITAGELVKMGLSQDDIDDLRAERPESPEQDQRTDSATSTGIVRDGKGDSERQLWIVVGYLKCDANGDGESETLRVVYAHAGGRAGKIIERVEWDGPASIALASPILQSHAIVGRCLFDQAKDLQLISSVLTRGLLDNQYIVNRPRPVVSDQVILDSLLDWVPGAPIRLKAGARPLDGHVQWLNVPDITPSTLTALEYFATVRENRLGTNRQSQGLDADSLNKTARGMNLLMSASAQRQKLIARVLAETFVARIYRLVYRAIKKAATGPEQYFTGQTFRTVDPTKWPDDMDLTVNVGLGTGNTQQELEHLNMIGVAQGELLKLQGGVSGPFVMPEHVANLTQKMSEKLGFKTPGIFFAPPEAVKEFKQPEKQDPEMMKVQAKAAADQAQFQADSQLAQQKLQADIAQKQQAAQIDLQLKREQAQLDLQLAREQAEQAMDLERQKAALNAQLKREEMTLEAELEAWKVKNAPAPNTIQQQAVS